MIKRRYWSPKLSKQAALRLFHQEVIRQTETLISHTHFEIVCPAPEILEVRDLEQYAIQWIDKGWSADVVSEFFENGKGSIHLRLRSYIDALPY